MRFDGKFGLITGAGSGIGRATAMGFAQRGGAIAVADLNRDAAQTVVNEIIAAGGRLGGTTTTATSGGVATFDGLSIDQIGSPFRIQATSPGLTSATTGDLAVTSAAPVQLVITLQPPSSVTAGSGFAARPCFQ